MSKTKPNDGNKPSNAGFKPSKALPLITAFSGLGIALLGCVLHDLAEFPATATALIIIGIGVTFVGFCLFHPSNERK